MHPIHVMEAIRPYTRIFLSLFLHEVPWLPHHTATDFGRRTKLLPFSAGSAHCKFIPDSAVPQSLLFFSWHHLTSSLCSLTSFASGLPQDSLFPHTSSNHLQHWLMPSQAALYPPPSALLHPPASAASAFLLAFLEQARGERSKAKASLLPPPSSSLPSSERWASPPHHSCAGHRPTIAVGCQPSAATPSLKCKLNFFILSLTESRGRWAAKYTESKTDR